MFFCIPAQGHTNPTIPVVEELIKRGHQVRYYSFDAFRERIKTVGAEYISCAKYLPELTEKGKEKLLNVSTTEMTIQDIDITARIDAMLSQDVESFQPDCIVSDSVCFWGKLIAKKYNLPMICSTTTIAFNRYSSKYIANSFGEMADILFGMPKINKALKRLRPLGYDVKNAMSIVQNDNDTDTIVYTSKSFQPYAETFSEHYAFVRPSVKDVPREAKDGGQKHIYISLGTVLANRQQFHRACIDGLKGLNAEVTISVGKETDPAQFQPLPENIIVYPYVNQMKVLASADVFLTHCGMNSVSESLYMGVPLVMYPKTGEQKAVAKRAGEMGAGFLLENSTASEIRAAVERVLDDEHYRINAEKIPRRSPKLQGRCWCGGLYRRGN